MVLSGEGDSMKNQTCCFTGHRQLPKEDLLHFADKLLDLVISLADEGIIHFKNGGATGFDQLAALAVLLAREVNPSIRLEMALPHKGQADKWDEVNKKIYDHILSQADEVVYVSEKYYRGCIHNRNRNLIDNSDVCVCYLTKDNGGTAYTVNYAKQKGLRIINMALDENAYLWE